MATELPGVPSGMIERIRGILLAPKAEWERIDAEPATVQGIMMGWVAPLAAIGPVCGLIGSQLFGISILGITWRPSIVASISQAIVAYVLALVAVFVVSLIIDALAPTFNGTKNPVQAMKVAAYSSTAGWLAGVFQLLPMLGVLAILAALYNLYLFWLGLPKLMKAPEDKAIPYVVVTILVAIVVFAAVGALTSVASGIFTPHVSSPYGSITVG